MRTVSASTALDDAPREPTVQMPVAWSYTPSGAAETNVIPAGSTSLTVTPVAGLGPWLTTTMLKVIASPTAPRVSVWVLRILRFAEAAALSDTLALSFVGLGSASVCCVFWAWLTSAPGASTLATMVSVAGVPTFRSPTVHAGAV